MPSYAVPALDKGLDILELLADSNDGLSQAQIATETGRSVGEIFRVLQTLERRGYLVRDPASGLYSVSLMMFELAHRNPPLRGLVQAALGPMRRLSTSSGQTCNLSVLDARRVLVIAQVESPGPFGFQVRVGAEFPVESTATGAVLLASAGTELKRAYLGDLSSRDPEAAARLSDELAEVAARGYARESGRRLVGIVDIVFPIVGTGGFPAVALTVPCAATTDPEVDVDEVVELARDTAAEISEAIRPHP
ncbi:IclR family transcriptional regulator [Diaminobutyricibacter tongyongensis]|uniref:IclR family transcriptional regulator n=1 Tax=Leifsonia tongyongensis TaxID=1268043 RepID=A0A6L9XZY3_9MICO|nr:IclR family transcriptional regulator [Diaminobutyricibacter tongyongensis]NEN06973.1 IclR family transcriptional regulator [Diaminobutyricibacter tongyongensis]